MLHPVACVNKIDQDQLAANQDGHGAVQFGDIHVMMFTQRMLRVTYGTLCQDIIEHFMGQIQ